MSKQTRSGRTINKPGVSESKTSALQKLKAARDGGIKQTEMYEVSSFTIQVQQQESVFNEVDEEEYENIKEKRRNDDFIVDDNGLGYADDGEEIYDYDEPKAKKSKLEVSILFNTQKKQEGDIKNFMFPMTAALKKANQGQPVNKSNKKVTQEKSKDILKNLEDQIDDIDDEEIQKAMQKDMLDEQQELAFNQEQKLAQSFQQPARVEGGSDRKRNHSEAMQDRKDADESANDTIYHDARSRSSDVSNRGLPLNNSPASNLQIQGQAGSAFEEWKKIKKQNAHINRNFGLPQNNAASIGNNVPLPMKDGQLKFFWTDAHEENYGSEVFLFGKIYVPQQNNYQSCCVIVKGMQRELYALPKFALSGDLLSKEEEQKHLLAMHAEFQKIKERHLKKATNWKCKFVQRKYAFEMPIPRREMKFLKMKYDATQPPLPQNLKGETFQTIFGTNQSMLELFLIKRKIKGPSWMTITNPQKIHDQARKTWCKYEVTIDCPKNATVTVEDLNELSPPLSSLCLSFKTVRNAQNGQNEIAMISCLVHDKVQQDGPTNDPTKDYKSMTFLRKLDRQPLPADLDSYVRKNQSENIRVFESEKALLEAFINKLYIIDPDMLIAHNLCGSLLEILLARINTLNINHWSRLGRYKRQQRTKTFGGSFGASWMPRQISCGRLLVDTFLSAKELVRETKYELGYLCQQQFGKERVDFEDELLPKFFLNTNKLVQIIDHTENDCFLTFQLLFHLAIIPLTKQLTNIAGNLWYRSLANARAERNEILLMHEFYKRKYVCPDKPQNQKKSLNPHQEAEEAENTHKKGKRKKAAYSGGYVLEPKAGFYDTFILLLDFNSLYPSIIQEFSLCFTTVDRRPSKNFDNTEIVIEKQFVDGEEVVDDEEINISLPDKDNPNLKTSILPEILKNLVEKRKAVKKQIKDEKNKEKLQQLDIRQKAIKLTANSMYGCLGFTSSRFHAKAIAALVTRTGREILMKTQKIAEEELGFNVVYGDTDSIMINTGTNDIKQAIAMGKQLKDKVNVLHRCLEIEIDGIFKSLLLLKKKKYAAINIIGWNTDNPSEAREVKGLDMVRRDWCKLSKGVGNFVLDQILSGRQKEDVILDMNNFLSETGRRMKEGEVTLAEYIIVKQLTRSPSEYTDVKSLPHVKIALRLKEQGKSDAELVNNFIEYVICENPEAQFIADKAFSPDEFEQKKLKIDVEWYATTQVLPPITRLIENIDGIEMDFVAQCLGIDPKKFNFHSSKSKNDDEEGEGRPQFSAFMNANTFKSLLEKTIGYLSVTCLYCKEKYNFPGVYQNLENVKEHTKGISGMVCLNKQCGKDLPTNYLLNLISKYLRQLMVFYYEGNHECKEPSCKTGSRHLSILNKCPIYACNGDLTPKCSEQDINSTLRYLQSLFDIESICNQKKWTDIQHPHVKHFEQVCTKIKQLTDRSKSNKVDLGGLFGFMGRL